MSGSIRAIRSGSARWRLAAARDFLHDYPPDAEVLLVGASRGAADDFARTIAAERGVSFGVHRLSVTQFAARLAIVDLASRGRVPITRLGYEALAARATFDAVQDHALGYLRPVHDDAWVSARAGRDARRAQDATRLSPPSLGTCRSQRRRPRRSS